jgi:hypothetical protein
VNRNRRNDISSSTKRSSVRLWTLRGALERSSNPGEPADR